MADGNDTLCVVYMATNLVNGKRYIGVTNKGMDGRRRSHLSKVRNGERGCPRFYDAIRKYGDKSFIWEVLVSCETFREACEHEIRLISEENPEYNVARGGWLGNEVAANRRPVVCLEDGIVYPSGKHAADAYGIGGGDISGCCKFKRRTAANGRHFIFHSSKLSQKQRDKLIRKIDLHSASERSAKRRNTPLVEAYRGVEEGRDAKGRLATGPMRNSKKVICLDDNVIFPSASAAARHYRVCRSAVIELCNGQKGRKQVSGYRFVYAQE